MKIEVREATIGVWFVPVRWLSAIWILVWDLGFSGLVFFQFTKVEKIANDVLFDDGSLVSSQFGKGDLWWCELTL